MNVGESVMAHGQSGMWGDGVCTMSWDRVSRPRSSPTYVLASRAMVDESMERVYDSSMSRETATLAFLADTTSWGDEVEEADPRVAGAERGVGRRGSEWMGR